MKDRPLYQDIWAELASTKAMVFLSGPRQAGKTTLARMIASRFTQQVYFNWDLVTDKKKLIETPTFFEGVSRKDSSPPLVILDEIHKYKKWKNYLKGIYDGFSDRYRFLVLGSGRLNVFQKGGDSLAGRYFQFTLWPFTLAELTDQRRTFQDFIQNPLRVPDENSKADDLWKNLSALSGFPEPFLSGKESTYRRWARAYHEQLIREDIRNMTEIKDIDHIEILFSLLPSKVGNPFSAASLARDLQVSVGSVQKWIKIFESFYLAFLIGPWTKRISRAITKEKKLYLYDYGGIPDLPVRFENMVALELWRAVSNWNDLGLGNFDLHYVRNKEKEETDFLISRENQPWLLVEAKFSDEQIPKSLLKFQDGLKVPAIQLVNKPGMCRFITNGCNQIEVVSASRWLAMLP